MALPSLSVDREFAAERINAVINHPSIRPWVGVPGQGYIDVAPVIADHRNILLMGQGGGFVFQQLEPGIYEAHSQFLPEFRGENVLTAARDALRYMFTRTDCFEVRTKVPHNNAAALGLAKRLHFDLHFERDAAWATDEGLVGVSYYVRTINRWAGEADEVAESGAWFHEKLEATKAASGSAPLHDDDAAHDRYVGATVEMFLAGQVAKAVGFYNRWAAFAGYGPIFVIADNPVVVDIGDALIAVKDGAFSVLLCR